MPRCEGCTAGGGEKDQSVEGQGRLRGGLTFIQETSWSRNKVAFAAMMGKAGIWLQEGSSLSQLAW